MASPSPSPYTKRRSPPPPPSISPTKSTKTTGGFFCKSLLLALFLLSLPLFPSQAPDFVAETVLTKLWELIHLLFVGIAVAYGLFSRRNVESSDVVDLNESSLSYVSRIFHVPSFFDDELENSCESVVVKERELESEYGEINQVQAWSSQCFQGRSKVVVVARPAYGLDGHVLHQSLGLPVRSLRSALRDESLADEEVIAVPWQMMGMEDNYLSNLNETHCATLKSRSSHSASSSSSSSSSQASFVSHTEKRFSPSRSVSEESLNSNLEESDKEKSVQGSSSRSSSPSLPPSPKLLTDDADTYSGASHSRDGSLLEDDVKKGFEDEFEGRRRRREFLGSKSLKLAAESSRRQNKPRSWRSYPPASTTSLINGADDSSRRRDLHRKSDGGHLFEEADHKGWSQDSLEVSAEEEKPSESLFQPMISKASRRAKHSSRGSLSEKDVTRDSEEELDNSRRKDLADNTKKLKSNSPRCEPQAWRASSKSSESLPAMDVQFQQKISKASRRAMHSSRGSLSEKDVRRNSEEDLMELDMSKRRDLAGDNTKKLKSNSPRCELQAWRASSKRGLSQDSSELSAEEEKSAMVSKPSRRAMHSSRESLQEKDVTRDSEEELDNSRRKDLADNTKKLKSNSPRCEPQAWRGSSKVSLRGKSVRTVRSDSSSTKSRRQKQELSIVLHQENTQAKSEPEVDVIEETETEAEPPQESLVVEEEQEEEEEAAWESQSNASHDHNEVDRKAGEFIAKFREQIRLQKLASGEQPRGGGGGGTGIIRSSHFR